MTEKVTKMKTKTTMMQTKMMWGGETKWRK